jgi:hypothetical protein
MGIFEFYVDAKYSRTFERQNEACLSSFRGLNRVATECCHVLYEVREGELLLKPNMDNHVGCLKNH